MADIFIKALAQDNFENFRKALGVEDIKLSLKGVVNISRLS